MRFWNILARSLKERFPERAGRLGAWAGGVWGLPEVAMRKTMRDPLQDTSTSMEDYYQRAFGPAAVRPCILTEAECELGFKENFQRDEHAHHF